MNINRKKEITVHNNGTNALFNFIYNSLLLSLTPNKDSFYNSIPAYIDIQKGTPNITSYSNDNSVLISPLVIAGRHVSSDSNGIEFSAVLPHSMLQSDVDLQGSGSCLLLSNDKSKVLAYVTFRLSDLDAVKNTSDGQATIRWQMSFSN